MEMMTGFLGDTVIVNGRAARDVPLATRAYRVRFLNGSNARIYKLGWGDGTPMTVIGSDGGLLEQPLRQTYVTLAPGERADVLLDLSTRSVGSTLMLNSLSFSGVASGMGAMGGMGRGRGGGRGGGTGRAAAVANGDPLSIATLRIARRERASFTLPSRLSTYDGSWRADGLATPAPKRITLSMQRMQWLLNGRTFEMTAAAPDETVALGSKEVWELDNRSGGMMQMAHPIHLHGRQFRVLKREIDPAMSTGWNSVRGGFSDAGWKDTVLVMPGERVQILSHFTAYRGLFLYHCHNLEHEDLGMMRNYRVR
jgi:FtsP/CotA-like multicopper oxidase with cupredoxin domain